MTAFVDVAVIPMDRERVVEHQTILVGDGRIIALGPAKSIAVPAGTRRIDGRGKFLIPGLADMHAHIHYFFRWGAPPQGDQWKAEAENMLFLWLANGVTTVRLMTGWPEFVPLKERAAAGELLSPRMYVSTGSTDTASFTELKAKGIDFIKTKFGDTTDRGVARFAAIVAAARRAGLPVTGHLAPKVALAAHAASLEHLDHFGPALGSVDLMQGGHDPREWRQIVQHPIDEAKLRALAVALRDAGLWTCPTELLIEINRFSADSLERWPEVRYLKPETVTSARQLWRNGAPADSLAAAEPVIAARRRIIKALHENGAPLLLGTDTPVAYLVPGFAVHRELEVLVQSGLTPYQALETGTKNMALYFGTLDSVGTIAQGKRADLVLLDGNPLVDIRRTAGPAGVMIGGRWLARGELDRRLRALEGKAF